MSNKKEGELSAEHQHSQSWAVTLKGSNSSPEGFPFLTDVTAEIRVICVGRINQRHAPITLGSIYLNHDLWFVDTTKYLARIIFDQDGRPIKKISSERALADSQSPNIPDNLRENPNVRRSRLHAHRRSGRTHWDHVYQGVATVTALCSNCGRDERAREPLAFEWKLSEPPTIPASGQHPPVWCIQPEDLSRMS